MSADGSPDADPVIMRLMGVSKRYENGTTVVRDLDLSVREGEFVSLLGPSGCGKTTTLRMVAGLERPSAGRIVLRGRDVTDEPAHRRPVNTVFQDYALFPHLSVRRNVGFGLAMQRMASAEIDRRVGEMLAIVGLAAQAEARPARLSGGQKQRVALARALVREPALLLLDEPLSALDAQLRLQMQAELKLLQARLGVTCMLVTHDQSEALSLSDRIAVMQGGRIVQFDRPDVLYDQPQSGFVARFLGAVNLLRGEWRGTEAWLPGGMRLVPGHRAACVAAGPCMIAIRPEDVVISSDAGAPGALLAVLLRCTFQGSLHRLELRLPDHGLVLADMRRDAPVPQTGETVRLQFPPGRVAVLPVEAAGQ